MVLPAITIPIACLQLTSGQPSFKTTVNAQEQPLLPLKLLPQTTPVALKVNVSQPLASPKKQPQKVIALKHPPKAKTQRKKSKTNTRPYTAPAIVIRVAIAQNVSNVAIAPARPLELRTKRCQDSY